MTFVAVVIFFIGDTWSPHPPITKLLLINKYFRTHSLAMQLWLNRMLWLLVRSLRYLGCSAVISGMSGLLLWLQCSICRWAPRDLPHGWLFTPTPQQGTTLCQPKLTSSRIDHRSHMRGCDGCSLYEKVNVMLVRWLKFMTGRKGRGKDWDTWCICVGVMVLRVT